MEEIIAKRANVIPAYIVFIIISLILIVCGIFLPQTKSYTSLFYFGTGIFCLGVGIFATIRVMRLPKYFIVLRDGKLFFPDGSSCTPDKIENVTVIITRGRRSFASTSTLELTAGGKNYKFICVHKAEAVKNRLAELKAAYRTKSER